MKVDELTEKGLLIKSQSNRQEIDGSMAIAERFLEKARGNQRIQYYDIAFSLAYQSMFHAARALLFSKNLKERSHAALIAALKELYCKDAQITRLLETMNHYRMTRHGIQYSGIGCSKEDAEEAIDDAERFVVAADKVLAGEQQPKTHKKD